jgi:hypothetical protein
MTRLRALVAMYALDTLAVAAWGLVSFGAAQVPGGWGAVLGPVVLGLGLLATVRFGAR